MKTYFPNGRSEVFRELDMTIYKILHMLYQLSRKIVRSTGQINHIRILLGPLAGRFMFKMAPDVNGMFILNGQKMVLASVDRYPPIDMAMDQFEQETVRIIERKLGSGMIMVDIGAHVGYFSLLGASLVGNSGKIYAFEPEPENYKLLSDNIKRNGYQNVSAQNKAVSGVSGQAELFISGLDNGSHSIYQNEKRKTTGFVPVETVNLDEFIRSEGSPKVDLIKIDVEGAEIDVIQGMTDTLNREEAPTLLIEFCPFLLEAAGKQPVDLIKLVRQLGFRIQYIDENAGMVALESEGEAQLIETLLKHQTYVNIYCVK